MVKTLEDHRIMETFFNMGIIYWLETTTRGCMLGDHNLLKNNISVLLPYGVAHH